MLICSNVGGDGTGVESIKEIKMYTDNNIFQKCYIIITVKYVFFEKTHDKKTNLRSLECYKFRIKKKLVI